MSDSWQQLDEEFFNQARVFLAGKKIKLSPFKPREHQVKALKESKNHFIKEDNSRGKLIFPCGAGKSLTGFWITQELKAKSTIIAVPSLSLVKQTLEVYLREIVAKNKKIKWLCICSDEGIGTNDDVAIFTENLGVPCQTDPAYIERWLKDNIEEEKIIFTTYQSGRIIAEISKRLNFKFDLGIFDEAHKTVGSNKKLFSHLLFEENISISKRIFMTATERFYAGSKDDIISMDDEDIYGDTFAKMSFKEAIEIGLLSDYKVITIDIKKSEIAEFIRDNNLVQLNDKWKKETEARSLASMLALRKATKRFPIKNAVSFHSSIEKAVRNKELQQHITETYDYEPIDVFTVSGKQSTSKRNDIVQEFACSNKALITNARCLTEGVDVPNIDCIVFADPRQSRVDIVQALGRALRKKEGKDWGYVILPVIYDEETHEIDNDSFNEILAIVRGLASNDERIVEYFKDKNQEGGNKKKETDKQFHFDVFSDYIDEAVLSEQLQIRLWDKISRFNWMEFEEAREYIQKFQFTSATEFIKTWREGKLALNIPAKPHARYKDKGWTNWADFLGTDNLSNIEISENYLPFEDARSVVQNLNLKSFKEWRDYLDSDNKLSIIPSNPRRAYKNDGFISIADFVGYNNKFQEWLSYDEAKLIVRELNITTQKEWNNFSKLKKRPLNIPGNPQDYYNKIGEWISWDDFLGKEQANYFNFIEAKNFVQKLGLINVKEWINYYSNSTEFNYRLPKTPAYLYRNEGWKGYGDFLGNGRISNKNRNYTNFIEARDYVRGLNLKNQNEWSVYRKSNKKLLNIPTNPENVYKEDGWVSLGDWLGTGVIAAKNIQFVPFKDAKEFAKQLGLKTSREWREYKKAGKRPTFIPANPDIQYKNEWKGWDDFFGYVKKEYYNFNVAKEKVKFYDFKTSKDYKSNYKSDDKFPSDPPEYYKKVWKGWADFLGKEK